MKARPIESIGREAAAISRGEVTPGRVWVVEKRADGSMERRQVNPETYRREQAARAASSDEALHAHRKSEAAQERFANSGNSSAATVGHRERQGRRLSAGGSDKSSYNEFFIEWREEGDYAVRRPKSDRASAVEPTQREAIEKAKALDPDATIHVERVRHTEGGSPDKWRKL